MYQPFIHVGEGHQCWLVSISDEKIWAWKTLKSFKTNKEALAYALSLTNLRVCVGNPLKEFDPDTLDPLTSEDFHVV